jgi:hypothetical protein
MCLSDSRIEAKILKGDVTLTPPKETRLFHVTTTPQNLMAVAIGCGVSFLTVVFSLVFPYIATPTEAKEIYRPAFYQYDPEIHHFDNSIWTYGTDYGLMVVMVALTVSILRAKGDKILKRRAAGLLLSYAVSVFAGAVAHHFFLTLESRNTIAFRLLWTLCVGTVTAAGGFMGACGSQIGRLTGGFYIPECCWLGFGAFTTAVCMAGYMSFQRPACDIFVAGCTQVTPTVYICLLAVMSRYKTFYRSLVVFGFFLNAPLLPIYSWLVFHTDWSLGRVNTLLHTFLCVAWTSQGLALKHFATAQPTKEKAV